MRWVTSTWVAVGVGVEAPFLEMQTLEDISQSGVRFSGLVLINPSKPARLIVKGFADLRFASDMLN